MLILHRRKSTDGLGKAAPGMGGSSDVIGMMAMSYAIGPVMKIARSYEA